MNIKANIGPDASLGKGEVESSILSGSTIKSTTYPDGIGPALCRTGHERARWCGKNPAKPAIRMATPAGLRQSCKINALRWNAQRMGRYARQWVRMEGGT